MTKDGALKLIQALPDDLPPDQVADELEKIRFMAEVEAGLAELDRGEEIPHDEIERLFPKWRKD